MRKALQDKALAPFGDADGPLFPAPDDPMAVARQLQPEWQRDADLTLRRWRGTWQRWHDGVWSEQTDADIRSALYHRLEHATYLHVDGRSGIKTTRRWAPVKGAISNLTEAIEAITNLPNTTETGTWLDHRTPAGVIPCRNGLLRRDTRELLPPTPAFFNTSQIPLDYDPNAPAPTRWLEFLASLWPEDPASIETLQEIFGYTLSGRRDLQKIMLIVGPKRSGKGTLSHVLTQLMGIENTVSPTLTAMGTNFGLQPLIGKSLVVIPDSRRATELHGAVENLLMISGQDRPTIDRKHRDPWTGQIPAQIIILSNELPTLPDTSGAIATRMLTLRLQRSFYGREDKTLLPDLLEPASLAGILLWALDGMDRLTQRGHFLPPESAREATELMEEGASPTLQFLRDRCHLDPTATVSVEKLWTTWQQWCLTEGHKPGNKIIFAKDLFAAAPTITRCKPLDPKTGKRPPSYRGMKLL